MTAFSLQMSEPAISQAIHKHLSIYDNVDENTVNDFIDLVNRHSDLFNHLAKLETDPEFLPYVEKYSNLKFRLTGQLIDPDVKIVFSRNPLISSNYYNYNSMRFGNICDYFTRVLFIDHGLWNHYKHNERVKEAIIFHGIGHCDLKRNHTWEGNLSFMDVDTHFFIVSDPTTFADFEHDVDSLTEEELLYYANIIIENRIHLDELFEIMYQELFSRQNRSNEEYCIEDECITPEEYVELFEVFIPTLKHMTIGPLGDTLLQF